MAKLCIVLNSLYKKKSQSLFNAEVQQDLCIVRDTLQDHLFLEINIPLEAGTSLRKKIISQALKHIDIDESTACHIVLNTHGTPGYSDLKHDCVIYLVYTLSLLKANITQISALQCDGMKQFKQLSTSMNPYKRSMPNSENKIIYREADLFKLQKKLNRLILEKAQSFKIYGFDEVYNPFENEDTVKDILTGKGVYQLDVIIYPRVITEEYLYQIECKLDIFRSRQELTAKTYQELTNFFATLQKHMKQHLLIAAKKNIEIEANSPLWALKQALNEYAETLLPYLDPYNAQHLEIIYKKWLKTYKLYSENRIDVISHFARFSTENYQDVINSTKSFPPKN